MSDFVLATGAPRARAESAVGEGRLLRSALIVVAAAFLLLFLLLPLAVVFAEAFAKGVGAYFQTFLDPDVQAAIRLTLTVSAIVVPLNTAFGLCAAWWIAKFDFRGKQILLTLIDLRSRSLQWSRG
jgi:sulfate transport system permease protein